MRSSYIHRFKMSMVPAVNGMPLPFVLAQVVLVILALVPIVASGDLNSRTVKTKYGDLKGVIVKLERNLGGVEVFRGVPYASPPVGSLRFMPPVNGAPWHGVKVADKFGPVCPQKLPNLNNTMPPGRMEYLRRLLPLLRNQSEDCLYLNIYAPAQANYEKGLRRLKKFFTDDAVLSTGEDVAGEIEAQGNHLRTLDVTETQNELEDLPTLIPNYPVATGVVSNALDTTDFGQILVTVVSQIQHTEKRILREMEAMKRSILYDTQVRADEVKNTVLVNSVSSLSTDVSQHVERLGFVLPCTTVESFEAFDAAIAVDKEKRKSLDCIMIRYTIGNNEFTSSLSAILSSLLAKDVQLQYSACGREIRGIKKKNFSETETFKCLDAGARDGGNRRYPVMVFVHGESYEWSSGNPYDGSVLASYGGVVVVTINYRLGILGFLNANTDSHLRSPANYGLMDQIAALHWVQENIAVFGGDPGNVTLVGHGTGAACVNFLMTTHAVPDGRLFHRGILMSGSALSPWALVRGAANYAMQVAKHLNCSSVANDPQKLLKCLREVSMESLLSAPVQGLAFAPAFGPSIDGVVIDAGDPDDQDYTLQIDTINTLNNILLRKGVIAKLSRYDLMVGVVRSEAYFTLTAEDAQYGIEADRRTKILREFVRNTYTYHQPEILATIINEYTDWEKAVQHPVNIRDETLEALGDANTVAPATRTADLHSQSHRNSYLYVFDYQTKNGDYPQRQGCIHGEELPYLFGAPLVGGLSHWPKNYTKSEIALSESVILYFTNFARTGNPNEGTPDPGPAGSRPDRTKLKNVVWTAYEEKHKNYLIIDTKSKLKSHYRAHRLSFWLNLVPDLHKPGSDEVPRSHHLLDAEQVPPRFIQRVPTTARSTTPEVTTERMRNTSTASPSELAFEETTSQPEDGFAAYSTALSVTIAIGCSLLILNVLIFAGVYYQRDKYQQHHCPKKRQENGQMPNNICGELETKTSAERHHIQHMPPPDFADLQNNSCHVPMPPPPPKNTKPSKPTGQNLIMSPNQLQQESMPMSGVGTLKKGHNHQQIMEELRV